MTHLELVLTAIIWIAYGAFAAYQTGDDDDEVMFDWIYPYYIIFAPGVLICKALYGIFKKYR
jgi:hypothetical protein